MDDTSKRADIGDYIRDLDRQMAAIAAAGLSEDFYAIPLRKPDKGPWLQGEIPLARPGRRLRLELRRSCIGDGGQRHVTARLLGLALPGRWCETALAREEDCPALEGEFDFRAVRFSVRITPHPGPHPVAAVATLERLGVPQGSPVEDTSGA